MKIVGCCTTEACKRNEIVIHEGARMEYAVIIKSGLFEISKNFMVNKLNSDQMDKKLLESNNSH
jgi:hypothetical protein